VARHNKKRNVGLIYEQLVMRMSKAVVENDSKIVKTVQEIIQRRFRKDSYLYKEFRLFNAMIRTSSVSDSLATRILSEAQKAAADHNGPLLDREKSELIKDINYNLNESDFYDQRVSDYTNYATIQTLLNSWRSSSPNIKQMIIHESKIHSWLQRDEVKIDIVNEAAPGINDLTVAVMEKKFEKKYGDVFSSRQKLLVQAYISENAASLTNQLQKIEADLSRALHKYKKVGSNKILLEKTEKVKSRIDSVSLTSTPTGVAHGMVLCQLLNELNGESHER
jgi:hypothetical protein